MTGLDVEAVLSQHRWFGAGCSGCDWHSSDSKRLQDDHRAHVAAVLRAEIDRALADAWDEGWAARAQTRMPFLSAVHLDANPYRPTLAATEGDRQ